MRWRRPDDAFGELHDAYVADVVHVAVAAQDRRARAGRRRPPRRRPARGRRRAYRRSRTCSWSWARRPTPASSSWPHRPRRSRARSPPETSPTPPRCRRSSFPSPSCTWPTTPTCATPTCRCSGTERRPSPLQASRVGRDATLQSFTAGLGGALRAGAHRLRPRGTGRADVTARRLSRHGRAGPRLPDPPGPPRAPDREPAAVQRGGGRHGPIGVQRADPHPQGGAGRQRHADEPQPRAVRGSPRRLGAQPRHRRERRAVQPRLDGRPHRRGAALLPRDARHRPGRGRAPHRARLLRRPGRTGAVPGRGPVGGGRRAPPPGRAPVGAGEGPVGELVRLCGRDELSPGQRRGASTWACTASPWCASTTTSTPSATPAATRTTRCPRARCWPRSARSSAGSTDRCSICARASPGRCPATKPVPVYGVKVDGDDVLVELP